jgi:uncharacterized protein with PIN domain
MARKSKYDQLVDSISKRLQEMAPENCQTIEEALRNDEILANAGLAAPSSAADYSYCPDCGHVRWHGVCQVCK